ncbi:hypothetical protein [Streptomyces sp. NPDC058657]|uniref:hypothetical protein n=1 Tax=unclassified Streptomyces TaxID=2593676 RepID=UPI003669DB26
MTETPRLAREIRVERHGRIARLFFDGEEFPFHLAGDDPIVVGPVTQDEVPTVRFTVLTDRVALVNALGYQDPEPNEVEKSP